MAITLTITDREIRNITAGTAATNAGSGKTDGSIGAEYELTAKLVIGGTDNNGNPVTGWEEARVYFNPAMFVDDGYIYPPGNPPPPGYAYIFPTALSGGPYPMGLVNAGLLTAAETNGTCQLVEVSGGMELRYRFRITSDLRRHVTTGSPIAYSPNRLRRADMAGGPIAPGGPPFPNLGVSVFRTPPNRSNLRTIIHVARPDCTSSRYDHAIAFSARWYGQNKSGTGPGELGSYAVSSLERAGQPVTDFTLSTFEDTTLTMRIPKQPGWLADLAYCEHALIRTDQPGNQGGTFMQDYGQDFQTGVLTDGGSDWVFTRTIATSEVVFDKRYMLVLIVRAIDEVTPTIIFTNSFFSFPMRASALPTPLTVQASGTIMDYNIDPQVDYVATTVVDHIKCRVVLDAAAYNSDPATWHGQFMDDLQRVKLSAVVAGDSSVSWSRSWHKANGVWVFSQFEQILDIEFTDLGSGKLQVDFQVPIAYLNESGLPDWANETILFQWSFETDYPNLGWTVSYNYTQAIMVKDFQQFAGVIQSIEFFDFATGFPLQSMCDGEKILVKVTLNPDLAGDREWNLRVYWNGEGYGYAAPESERPDDGTFEEETYASPNGFAQLDNYELLQVPPVFDDDGVATFLFDHATVPEGEKVRIYVIAQPADMSVCEFATQFPANMEWANYGCLAGDQSGLEAGFMPVGERYYIKGHSAPYSGSFPGTTLFERNTGNIAVVTEAGAGVEGSNWDIIVVDPGQVVFVYDPPGEDYTRYFMTLTDYYYYTGGGSGKAAVRYLGNTTHNTLGAIGTTWAPPTFEDAGNIEPSHQTLNPAILTDGSMHEQDACRFVVIEYTTDADPGSATWTDAPDIPRLGFNDGINGWRLWQKFFTLNLPGGATFYRHRWERGPHVQGYGQPVAL